MPLITGGLRPHDRPRARPPGRERATPQDVITNPRVVASYLGTDEATINRSSSGPRVDGAVIGPTVVLDAVPPPPPAPAPAPAADAPATRRRREPLVANRRGDA